MGVPPVKNGPHPFLFFDDRPKAVLYGRDAILQWKSYALLPNREWNQDKNIKNSLGAKWNASHLAVRLCALRHWKRVSIPPTTQSHSPPSYEGYPLCPKDKNRSPFHGEKPQIIT